MPLDEILAQELIFGLVALILQVFAACDEVGDQPDTRMISTCGTVSAFAMRPVHTPELLDQDLLSCAFGLALLFFSLEVITVPRA